MTPFFRGYSLGELSRWHWAIVINSTSLCLGFAQPAQAISEVITPLSSKSALQKESTVSNSAQVLIAGADHFNPGLELPPPQSEKFDSFSIPAEGSSSSSTKPGLESLQTNVHSDGEDIQRNRFIEETAQFRLSNGNTVQFKTGFNSFEQNGVESVHNIPIKAGWEGNLGKVKVQAEAGVDLFDHLPVAPNFSVEASVALLPNVTLSGVLEKEPHKFNARTLNNQISALRFGPNLYWKIAPNTSLFSFYRRGNYNDGNREHQSFTRLEQKLGQFSVAANLFTWNYEHNALDRKGYFSPQDFLVYSGEIGWEGDVFKFLRCGLTTALGRQRLKGEFSNASTYQAHCTAKLSPNIEADLGYIHSNLRSRGTDESSNSQTVTGELRITF